MPSRPSVDTAASLKSPVALHVEALTQSMRTLDRLKQAQSPLTPQCERMIEHVTRLQPGKLPGTPDGVHTCVPA